MAFFKVLLNSKHKRVSLGAFEEKPSFDIWLLPVWLVPWAHFPQCNIHISFHPALLHFGAISGSILLTKLLVNTNGLVREYKRALSPLGDNITCAMCSLGLITNGAQILPNSLGASRLPLSPMLEVQLCKSQYTYSSAYSWSSGQLSMSSLRSVFHCPCHRPHHIVSHYYSRHYPHHHYPHHHNYHYCHPIHVNNGNFFPEHWDVMIG